MTTNNKTSHVLSSQLPAFVRDDHPTFVSFLEHYYRFLELEDGEIYNIRKLQSYQDIDRTANTFSEHINSYFLKLIPENVVVDKALLLKHVKDFYRARGTEKSVKFLLNILFQKTASLYYPKRDILKTSDGKWFVEKSLKIRDIQLDGNTTTSLSDIENFASTYIRGNTSNGFAAVESVLSKYEDGALVFELKLSNLVRAFESGETIYSTFEENGTTRTLTANTFSGVVSQVHIIDGGSEYEVGDTVVVESNTGSGASIVVSGVTKGNLITIVPINGGAGYMDNAYLTITGDGTTSNAYVLVDDTTQYYHPNTYNLWISLISSEANTNINNTVYSNLNYSNANVTLANAWSYQEFTGLGPVESIIVVTRGQNYTTPPTSEVAGNTQIRSVGILGRMEIISGGTGYQINNTIEFTNVIGGYGFGANGKVTNVAANGMITKVDFAQSSPWEYIGGAGYSQDFLPTANVRSNTGTGANVVVTAILGYGATQNNITETVGAITRLRIISGGTGYLTVPTLNLANSGDGTANANAEIITGVYTYPGRFLNDDGMLSSHNFLENRDYYQNYSYVVRIRESLKNYRKAINNLIHPSSMKLFGEYILENEDHVSTTNGAESYPATYRIKFVSGTYYARGNGNNSNISVNTAAHGLVTNNDVYIEFLSGSTSNVKDVRIYSGGNNYSNGYVVFESSSGANANAYVSVNTRGTIISITMNNHGTLYNNSDTVTANVDSLRSYNIRFANVTTSGFGYTNGSISFSGGSGRNANVYVTVNSNGSIMYSNVFDGGTGYTSGDTVTANVHHLLTFNIANVQILRTGDGYSNGFITFEGGSGFGANANVAVNGTGHIVRVNVHSRGTGYTINDDRRIYANVESLATYKANNFFLIRSGVNYSNGYIVITGGTGTGANANIVVNGTTGIIQRVTINNRGTGYGPHDTVIANVAHLITYNIANISIVNAGREYSNGYITFEGGSGAYANARITTNAIGSIETITISDRGTGYYSGNTVNAKVDLLRSYNVYNVMINAGGLHYSNGYIRFTSNANGRYANASISVNANGAIVSTNVHNAGIGFAASEAITILSHDRLTYSIGNLTTYSTGSGYSNGYISFEGGTGRLANGNITVNGTGHITNTVIFFGGTGYLYTDNVTANVIGLGGTGANVVVSLSYNAPTANLSATMQLSGNSANLPVTLQAGGGATINVGLTIIGNTANLPVYIQQGAGGGALTVVLQKGSGAANLSVNMQSEPLTVISNGSFRVTTSNTDYFYVSHANSANIFGTASIGLIL